MKLSYIEYQNLVEQSPILIWRSDTSKLCDYFNTRWLEFTGRTLAEECGNGWAEGVHPDDFDRCLEIYTSSFDKEQIFEMEYRLKRYDGEYRWLLDRGVPFYDENGVFAGYIGSCIDITETVEARALLQAQQENEIEALRNLFPICTCCKKIRDDNGYWNQVEDYLQKHSDIKFSHGICPSCAQKLYPDLDLKNK